MERFGWTLDYILDHLTLSHFARVSRAVMQNAGVEEKTDDNFADLLNEPQVNLTMTMKEFENGDN